MGPPLSTAFIDSGGIGGVQLLSSCLHPCLLSLTQLPQGGRQHLHTALPSVKAWRLTGDPWWQQVSCLRGMADPGAAVPRVRLLAAPRAGTSNAQPKCLYVVKTANYFSNTKSQLCKYSALARKSFFGCSICCDVCQRYLFMPASGKRASLACTNRIVSLSL